MFPSIVLALGLYYPRMNMKSFTTADGHFCLGTWDKTKINADGTTTRDRIMAHFHMDGGWNEERVIGFEPYDNRSFTNQRGEKVVIPPCPIKIWHGTIDTVVDPVISQEYIKAVRRGGCYAELRMIEGIGHKTIPSMRTELRMWFDRFRM
jgi:pimeloyl-ACP methyl ester carboxylesterase